MKVAMILAAGRGERMRPLTDVTPKPLLKIKNRSLIEYHLTALKKAGFTDVVINHAWLGQQLVDALGDGEKYGLTLHFSAEKEALETAGGIVHAFPLLLPLLGDNTCFSVINGDIFCDVDFGRLPTKLSDVQAHLVLVHNPTHNEKGDFGLSNSKVHRNMKNQFTFSGVAVYHIDMFSGLNDSKQPLAPLLFDLVKRNLVSGHLHNGVWVDVGTPERLAQLNQEIR